MQGVADAEGDAADELAVDQRRVHRAADVRADHHSDQLDRAGLGVDVGDHGRGAAGVGDLWHLERSARRQASLRRQLRQRHPPAARLDDATRVLHVGLRNAPASSSPLASLGDQLRRREVRRVTGGDGAARAVGADAALDHRGVGVTHRKLPGRETESLAQDLGEHGLEPWPHRRGARVHDQRRVGPRLDLGGLEGPEPGLFDVDREADAST